MKSDGASIIRNVSAEPVEGISAVVDIERLFPPGFNFRMNLISNLSLKPDEVREFSFKPTDAHYYYPDGTPLKDDSSIWSRWFDVRLQLTYRDRDGIIRSIREEISLGR